MFVRRSLMVFALALSVARCADQPTAVRPSSGPQFLRWSATPQFTSQTRARRIDGGRVPGRAGAEDHNLGMLFRHSKSALAALFAENEPRTDMGSLYGQCNAAVNVPQPRFRAILVSARRLAGLRVKTE